MLEHLRNKQAFICDMDGVLYHGARLLPGVPEFVTWLQESGKKFLFMTNSSNQTPRDLSLKLKRLGVAVPEAHFYTSALATAMFLAGQKPNGSAFVIGDTGLSHALYEVGFTMDDHSPDYVVVGESRTYNYENVVHAARLVQKGAKLIGCNPDMTDPSESGGVIPATGALIAPIELTTGRKAYFVGKPNPLMMRQALKLLGSTREQTVIIGDRMDTDIIAGLESEIETVLVLSGVTSREELTTFAYAPHLVLESVADIIP